MKKIIIILFLMLSTYIYAVNVNINLDSNISNKKIENKQNLSNKDQKTAEKQYTKCISCHGKKAEKEALGKSEVISSWNSKKIESELLEYKKGNHSNHGMGSIMTGQVRNLSKSDLKLLSIYISNFK